MIVVCQVRLFMLTIFACNSIASYVTDKYEEREKRSPGYGYNKYGNPVPSRSGSPLGFVAAILPIQVPGLLRILRLVETLLQRQEEDVREPFSGGYPGFLCPRPEDEKPFFPCVIDCTSNHGSVSGTCGDVELGDYNCYCSGHAKYVNPNTTNHCWIPYDEKHAKMCEIDCRCNHGTFGGYCDWERKACVCSKGLNPGNLGCSPENYAEFAKYLHKVVGPDKLGKIGMYYSQQAIEHYEKQLQ